MYDLWVYPSPLFIIKHTETSALFPALRGELLTLEVGKLKVVIVQRQVVLHGREAARPGGEVSHTLMFTVQHLSEVICNKKVSDQFVFAHRQNFEIVSHLFGHSIWYLAFHLA